MNDPTMPKAIVAKMPIGSRPGTSARAMKPAIAPMTMSVMMTQSTGSSSVAWRPHPATSVTATTTPGATAPTHLPCHPSRSFGYVPARKRCVDRARRIPDPPGPGRVAVGAQRYPSGGRDGQPRRSRCCRPTRRLRVTLTAPAPIVSRPDPVRPTTRGSVLLDLVRTTDHKTIGKLYLVTSLAFFLAGGLMALLMRGELGRPGQQFLSLEQYNQLFTMHGTIMLLLFATPMVFAFANLVLPLQIGAPDVAFPRLNAFSYWLFLFGGPTVMLRFITRRGAADFGWYAYAPLNNAVHSPGAGADLWFVGLAIAGLGTILGAVNMITTVVTLRAPGMTMFRMPIFTWNIVVTSLLVLLAFPILTAALFGALADRKLGAQVFEASNGGAILWQHLFWFFGHPEVYIVALPFFGIVTEIIPVFSRKPIFGYKGLVAATIAIGALSMTVWAHHMFATGAVLLPFFSFLTYLIAVPTGMKFFNWIGTMWRGKITFETPMLFSVGFLITFLLGGLSGVLLASPPVDFHVSDSYFVVAHFHYVLFGTIVFAVYSGIYFWFPKMFGRMLDERLGKVHFWLTFIGFHATFLVQPWLGK